MNIELWTENLQPGRLEVAPDFQTGPVFWFRSILDRVSAICDCVVAETESHYNGTEPSKRHSPVN
jgi:hypothetical protein